METPAQNFFGRLKEFSEMSSPIDFMLIFQNWELFLTGMANTLYLVIAALIIGGLISLPLALARANKTPVLNRVIWVYTYIFRGTPLLVQLYLIYYGLGQFEFVQESFLWPVLRNPIPCALIAFVLNTTAYTTEMLRGAIVAVPRGEIEAAKACGMSPFKRNVRVVLPNALRRALPAYSNEVIFMLHGSVVASLITVIDILGAGRTLNGTYYLAYEGFIAAGVLYMALVIAITYGFKVWERNWFKHLRPRQT